MIKKYFILNLFLSIIFCNNNSDINIINFYKPAIEGPVLTFDPSFNTAFYLNQYNPNVFSDHSILDIKINGSRFNSIGSYNISPLYLNFINDTSSSTAFEHNRGDYAHNENIIFINNKYENDISSIFIAQSKKYDALPSINSNSEVLQNYFLNIEKKYFSSSELNTKISSSLMYHKENMIVPLSNGSYNRKSEDFLAGFSASSSYNNVIDFNFSNSFQINRAETQLGLYSDNYNRWMDIDIYFKITKNLNLLASTANKTISSDIKINESEYLYNEICLNELSIASIYKNKKIILNINLTSYNQKNDNINSPDNFNIPRINFNITYNHKNSINYSLSKNTHSFISQNSNIINDFIAFNIDYKFDLFKLQIEPFYLTSYKYDPSFLNDSFYKQGSISGFNTLLTYKNNHLAGDIKGSLYNSNYASPLNFYINYSLLFAPKLSQNRFRPFFGINGVMMDINESTYIDISEDSSFLPYLNQNAENNSLNNSKIVNLLNLEIGLLLNQFKISYHFTNPLNDETIFSYSDNFQNIGSFSKLQVTWQFVD